MTIQAAPGQYAHYVLVSGDSIIARQSIDTTRFGYPAAFIKEVWADDIANGAVLYVRVKQHESTTEKEQT